MPQPAPAIPAVYTAQQVADILHVHYRTVLDWIREGHLEHLDLADPTATRPRYAVTGEQLDTFIAKRTRS